MTYPYKGYFARLTGIAAFFNGLAEYCKVTPTYDSNLSNSPSVYVT